MKYLEKDRVNRIVTWYVILFFSYSIIGHIVPLSLLLDGAINQLFYNAFAGVGALLLLIDFLTERYMFKTKYWYILVLFLVVTVISCLLNINYGVTDNVKTLVWTSIQLLLLYTLYIRLGKEKALAVYKKIFNILIIVWLCAAMVSIFQFMCQISYYVEVPGGYKRQGFIDNRLFGIFIDPNYASVTSLYVSVMSLYLWKQTTKKVWKVYYLFSAAVQAVYLILSGSRTAEVCALLAVFVWSALSAKNYLLQKDWKELKKAAIIGMCVICSGVVFVGVYTVSKRALAYLPELVMWGQEKDPTKEELDVEKLLKRMDVNSDNISNNRAMIWKSYLKVIEGEKNLLGLSPRNSLTYISEKYPQSYIAKTQYKTHNGYLSVFVGDGIIGLLVVMAFGTMVGVGIFKKITRKKEIEDSFITFVIIEGILLVYVFFISDLFFVNNITTTIFWSILGAVTEEIKN